MIRNLEAHLQSWYSEFDRISDKPGRFLGNLQLSYTFTPEQSGFLLRDDRVFINAYSLLTHLSVKDTSPFCEKLLEYIIKSADSSLTLIEPHGGLLEDIRHILQCGHTLNVDLLDRLIQFSWWFNQYSARHNLTWHKPPASMGMATFEEAGLFVRPGIVELRALQSRLLAPEQTRLELMSIIEQQDNEDILYAAGTVPMWKTCDINFNLRRLMTNAGFYATDDRGWEAFLLWSEAYFGALTKGTVLYHNKALWYSFWVLGAVYQQTGIFPQHLHSPPVHRFYNALADRKILLVTPFAEAINHLVVTDKIRHLYRHIQIPAFSLETLPAFISTYPNRPHGDYQETFEILVDRVDQCIATKKTDLFMASCGCYGLPLCHHVYTTYGITAVYMGNATNTLFGILQNTSVEFQRQHRIEENWIRGDLGRYKNMERIDKGRYV